MLPYLPIAQVVLPFQIEHPEIVLSMVIGFILLLLLVTRVHIPFLSVPHYRTTLAERSARIETNKQQVDTAIREVQHARRAGDGAVLLHRMEQVDPRVAHPAILPARREVIRQLHVAHGGKYEVPGVGGDPEATGARVLQLPSWRDVIVPLELRRKP